MVVSLASANLMNWSPDRDGAGRVVDLLAALDADVIAVQELVGDPAVALESLAGALGMACRDAEGVLAAAVGGGVHHTGLLWRPSAVEVVTGSVRTYQRVPDGMWHSMVTAVVDLGHGRAARVGSVQLSPFDPGLGWGWADAGQVLRAMQSDHIPGVVGGDWNSLGGDEAYDPDPYAARGVRWHPHHALQYGPDRRLDRSVAHRLERHGRMRDVARVLDVPWAPSTGHHPADPHPPRRIDRWYATHHLPDAALVGYRAVEAAVVGECSDHVPVVVGLDPTGLAGPPRGVS